VGATVLTVRFVLPVLADEKLVRPSAKDRFQLADVGWRTFAWSRQIVESGAAGFNCKHEGRWMEVQVTRFGSNRALLKQWHLWPIPYA